jgi:hypothetical protein
MSNTGLIPITLLVILVASAAGISMAPQPQELILRDIDGIAHGSLEHPVHRWNILFFLISDCPIAKQYAPEFKRICTEYETQGAECTLVYVDPSMTDDEIRQYMKAYGYDCCKAVRDPDHRLVQTAGVNVSSEVAVFARGAALKYRGRIDDFYAGLGTPRQRATRHDLRDALDDLVAGRRVREPQTEAFGCFISDVASESRS